MAAPAAESPPVATPVPISSPVPVAVREEIGAQVGDGSSPLPGKDETALKGSPTALARPDYLKNQEPDYPLAARRRGQQGVVVVKVTVSPAGRATEVTVKQSSGFAVLDEAALRAVRDYEFVPAQLGAIPVESKIEVPIRFKLNH